MTTVTEQDQGDIVASYHPPMVRADHARWIAPAAAAPPPWRMVRTQHRRVMLEHGSRARGLKLADMALAAGRDTKDYTHKLICWNTVIYLMQKASIIGSSKKFDEVGAHSWAALFPDGCPQVRSRTQFLAVPRGSILGFFKWDSENNLYLAHAAIALANGRVIGNNGGSAGLPNSLQQVGDMTHFHWGSGRSDSSYSIIDNGHQVSIKLVYRDVDGIGMPSSCTVM